MTPALRRRVLARLRRGRSEAAAPAGVPAPSEAERKLLDERDLPIIERAFPHTMTGAARLQALVDAVRYLESAEVPGAFVECGVWRGGSILAMLMTLQDVGSEDREMYLYDTFDGMTEPTEEDVSRLEQPALDTWRSAEEQGEQAWGWLLGDFDESTVRETVLSTGYPEACLHFVRGPVEETIPGTIPDRIALLRLDTDWYESTRHELEHLFPRLMPGGVLIVDDYGHWEGARQALDEYLERTGERLLLNRIDYAARIAVRTRQPGERS